jgi:hypothetical protein
MKQCVRCKLFLIGNQFRKDKSHKDGLEYYCRLCSREIHKAYDIKRNKEQSRMASSKRHMLRREFGLTPEQYQAMLVQQNYGCAICKETGHTNGRAMSVDHDHATGKVRGLLCSSCNTGIGQLKESPVILEAAIKYLSGVTCHLVR